MLSDTIGHTDLEGTQCHCPSLLLKNNQSGDDLSDELIINTVIGVGGHLSTEHTAASIHGQEHH